MTNHLVAFALLSALALHCAAKRTSSFPHDIGSSSASADTQRSNNIAVINIPAWNQFAARQVLRTQRRPNPTDVVSVSTLPGITVDGKNVPQRTLQVKFSGTKAQIADGVGKRSVVYPGSDTTNPSPTNHLQTTTPTSNRNDEFLPSQAPQGTLRVCNVGPPPFRTLLTFEDDGLANGVVSLLYYNNLSQVVSVCSGWLVHPLRVLTAAHCLHQAETNSSFVSRGWTLIVSTGLNGRDDLKLNRATVARVLVPAEYLKHGAWLESLKKGTDNALLVLSTPLAGRTYKWSSPVAGLARMILGYPGVSQTGFDQIGDIDGTPERPASFGCVEDLSGGNILCEDLSAEGGHSGSPLFAAFNSDTVVGTLSGHRLDACPALFTLAVPRVSGGVSATRLLRTSGCTVTSSGGVSKVSKC